MRDDSWKLQDAKARFSEMVRQAKAGAPQRVTVHGKEAVVVCDPSRFDVTPKSSKPITGREFIEASKKYRGAGEGVDFEAHVPMLLRDKRREIFDGEDEDKA
jgi:prevent-host-death family protein